MKRKQQFIEEEEGEESLPLVIPAPVSSVTNFSHYLTTKSGPGSVFKYITTQVQHLATMFRCLATIGDSIRLVISKDGITGTCINGSHTVMARYSLDAKKMLEGLFVPPENTLEVIVGLTQLANVLDANKKAESVCISVDNDSCPDRLHVSSVEDETTGFSNITLQNPEEPLTVPPISYNNRVVLQTELFCTRLRSRTDSKTVAFILDTEDNFFTMEFKNFMNELTCFSWPLEEQTRKTQKIRSRFELNTMINIFRISRATKHVSISMNEPYETSPGNKPLCLNFMLAAIGDLTFFVSPLTNDDDEDEEKN